MPYVLKTAGDVPLVIGPVVDGVSARALIDGQWTALDAVTDGRGLIQLDSDPIMEHDTEPNHMWISPEGAKVEAIELDLGREVPIDLMLVWNYNDPGWLDCGIRQADISVWTQEAGWRLIKRSAEFDMGQGTDDYDVPTPIRLDGTIASKVRLDSIVSFGGQRPGLAEVRFFTTRTAKADQPQPPDRWFMVVGQPVIRWLPGAGIIQQVLYLGPDPDRLTAISQIEPGLDQVRLTALVPGRRYYWRIDSTRPDGRIESSDTWSFYYGGLIAWYTFDQTSGTKALDSSGRGLDAAVLGRPQWRPDSGRIGGGLALDGVDDYLSLPCAIAGGYSELTVAMWVDPHRMATSPVALAAVGPISIQLDRAPDDHMDLSVSLYERGRHVPCIISQGLLEAGRWQFVAVTVGLDAMVRLYKDGNEIASTGLRWAPEMPDRRWTIGWTDLEHATCYKGLIDDLRIYAQVLSKDQVRALYEQRPLPQSGPDEASDQIGVVKLTPLAYETLGSGPTQGRRTSALPWLGLLVVAIAGAIAVGLASRRRS